MTAKDWFILLLSVTGICAPVWLPLLLLRQMHREPPYTDYPGKDSWWFD